MKKTSIVIVATLLIVASLALCFAGCGDTTNTPGNSGNSSGNSGNSSGNTGEEGAAKGSLAAIKAAGVLVVATNAAFEPFEYIAADGSYVGWDMDIARAFADLLGVKLEIRNMEFDSVLGAVATGIADIGMAGISYSETRDKTVDFSKGVFNSSQMIIVKSNNTDIEDAYDLAGKVVGAQRGTVGDLLAQLDPEWASDGKGGFILGKPSSVKGFGTAAEAVLDLANGRVDAVILDKMPAEAIVDKISGVKILENSVFDDEYAFAVAEGNAELQTWINEAIDTLKENGKWDEITQKYFG